MGRVCVGRRILRPDSTTERNEITGWSPDGSMLLVVKRLAGRNADIWCARLSADRQSVEALTPLLVTPARETEASFSPDGRWITYASDESGRRQVYVAPFAGSPPRLGAATRLTRDDGDFAQWASDGSLAVRLNKGTVYRQAWPGPTPAGAPAEWFDHTRAHILDFDVAPGGRAIGIQRAAAETPDMSSLDVILGWSGTLPRLMAEARR